MKDVAVGILLKDGNVLACQRRHDVRYPLKWEFPGGKIEPGETPEEAVRRELFEELSIGAVPEAEFHRQEWVYPESRLEQNRDGAFRVFYFIVRSWSGQIVNNVFEQVAWVSLDELRSMDILEGNREAVELLVKHGTV